MFLLGAIGFRSAHRVDSRLYFLTSFCYNPNMFRRSKGAIFKCYFMIKSGRKKLKIRVEKKQKPSRGGNLVVLENKAQAEEKKKLLIMRLGVAGVMLIFFAAWIFSLKYQFKTNAANNHKSSFDWEQTKTELDKALGQVKQGFTEIKQIQAAKQQNTLPRPPELTSRQINLLKGKLINETAASTASSTKK